MQFNSLAYAALLSVSFFLSWALSRAHLPRVVLLLAASYLFYANWRVAYLGLIVASSALDYVVGLRLFRSSDPLVRRRLLLVSLVGNLGLLGVFKYFNFFAHSARAVLLHMGVDLPPVVLDVVVPVGISFYTFQSLSYTIDIYRGALAVESPLEFFLFVAFFPQLVAGPIVRASDFLPQIKARPFLAPGAGGRGLALIALGLVKKSVIADLLAVNLVDRVFESPQIYTSAELLMGVYGYAAQIYCDFSAYTDMAIGSALLLGFILPQNFDRPYQAINLRDFWRRWHISLSTWLRDYLYISLGGSRGGTWRTYRNLALTMLLGGLWHGAAWTFVVWGAIHGMGLAFTRAFQRRFGDAPGGRLARLVKGLITFHVVCVAWIFFRAEDFPRAWDMLQGLMQRTGGTANITPMLWALLGAALLTHLVPMAAVEGGLRLAGRLPAPVLGLLMVAVVLAVRHAGTSEVVPFIYFQF